VSRRWSRVGGVAGANADARVVECAGVSAIVEETTALIVARLVVHVVEATWSALAEAEAEVAAAVELRRSSCAGVCRIISGAGNEAGVGENMRNFLRNS
jgi:ribosomal protein S5